MEQLESIASAGKERLLAVNFKSYVQTTAESAVQIAKAIEDAIKGSNVGVLLVPQIADLSLMVKKTSFEIFAPYCDDTVPGPRIGAVTVESIKKIGCSGFLVNRCDDKGTMKVVKSLYNKAAKNGLKVFAYVDSYLEAERMSCFSPFAIEFACNRELKSARRDLMKAIELFRKVSPKTKFLIGGGISSKEHVEDAIQLGADGIAIAGCLAKAENPQSVIKELVKGL